METKLTKFAIKKAIQVSELKVKITELESLIERMRKEKSCVNSNEITYSQKVVENIMALSNDSHKAELLKIAKMSVSEFKDWSREFKSK